MNTEIQRTTNSLWHTHTHSAATIRWVDALAYLWHEFHKVYTRIHSGTIGNAVFGSNECKTNSISLLTIFGGEI